MIPLFIITCDRLEVLKKSMQSYYTYIKTPFEVIIIDFGSTYEPTVEFLRRLESEGTKVYWEEKINISADLNSVGWIIKDYFKSHPESNYVVTDPDIEFNNVEGDILDVYSYLLEELRRVSVVGPMLRIDDIPDFYPKKGKLTTTGYHYRFHLKSQYPINTIPYKGKIIKYILAPIDTTFGMARPEKRWVRPMRGARVLAPYAARHLDWYLNPKKLTGDQKHYMIHASKNLAHWSRWEGII